MKTKFKPYRGQSSMQIEAENDQERALLHSVFGRYYYENKNKKDRKLHSPRLRLIREYQDGKVNKILVKQVDYISSLWLKNKGWSITEDTEGAEYSNDIVYYKRINNKRILYGKFNVKFTFYDVYLPQDHYLSQYEKNISELGWQMGWAMQYDRELTQHINREEYPFTSTIELLKAFDEFKSENACLRKYTIHTIDELEEVIKKITASHK